MKHVIAVLLVSLASLSRAGSVNPRTGSRSEADSMVGWTPTCSGQGGATQRRTASALGGLLGPPRTDAAMRREAQLHTERPCALLTPNLPLSLLVGHSGVPILEHVAPCSQEVRMLRSPLVPPFAGGLASPASMWGAREAP